ncbi:Concanavalin A-like lectin/glucanases superfamily domain-containing protein [Strongyloides ratti]|uniref:Concanavalin A-like lectin/glucanases superfamily domain-containing protein n=1 Tax=Strongyloides ratti TaxID=34506 RepID=A0A090KXQ0_STRRB|nr:Concanavalin A-like lectin/glucanases superfamily domain-containing protein [Strongyloides ratti]CEF60028.1 Concanavalin A-like lectin/glucanases superfamily domain-containing protein [Strongyloides ratti]
MSKRHLEDKFINHPNELNCDLETRCSWFNVKSDNILDTSDFYAFQKTSSKSFPYQVSPGPRNQPIGKKFFFAGNTTVPGESAIISSSPIGCQKGRGKLSFTYWLYNEAKIEVLLIKPFRNHRRVQLLETPFLGCNNDDSTNGICTFTFREINEPFKLGIRAFNLKDPGIGSFALISDITYVGDEICHSNPLKNIFGDDILKIKDYNSKFREIKTSSDLNANGLFNKSEWWNKFDSSTNWMIGKNTKLWKDFMLSNDKPKGTFLYQYIDEYSEKPYGILESTAISCTKSTSTLTFSLWITPGTQISLCSVNLDNVPLSCVDINDEDIQQPMIIDIEPSHNEIFKFIFEIINYDKSKPSIIVIDNISFDGRLCHEQDIDTVDEFETESLDEMFKPYNDYEKIKDERNIDCDYETSNCYEWVDNSNFFKRSIIPKQVSSLIPTSIEGKGNVGIFFSASKPKILKSPIIPCVNDGKITIHYYISKYASMKICVVDECLNLNHNEYKIVFKISSKRPFSIGIIAESSGPSFAIIKSIKTDGDFCKLPTLNEMACKKIQCLFRNDTCSYTNKDVGEYSKEWSLFNRHGIISILDENHQVSILNSPTFQLSSPIDIHITVIQSTFGSRLLMCEDDNVKNLDVCEQLMGPKINKQTKEILQVRLDEDIKKFTIVSNHDKYLQFGKAIFVIDSIRVTNIDGTSLC